MDYQIDARNDRTQGIRVGQQEREVATFQKASFFIHNLRGAVNGIDYQMKLAAPWNGFRYQLIQGNQGLASATRHTRMHAFESDRPLIRHTLVEFHLEVSGRTLTLTPQDRHGAVYLLEEAGEPLGRLALRPFEAQRQGVWQADFSVPSDWSVPLVAFAAWLAKEGRTRMN